MEIYKRIVIITIGIVSISLLSCNETTTENSNQKNLNYYSPTNTWDEIVADFSVQLPFYILFDKTITQKEGEIRDIKFKLQDEFMNLRIIKGGGIFIELPKKKIRGSKINMDIDDVENILAYKIKLNKDSIVVLEFPNFGAVGRSINSKIYFVIDKNYNSYIVSSYKSRIVCFSDFDVDGNIDFLEIEDTFYYAQIPFEEKSTEIYFFNLVKFKNGKLLKDTTKYANLAMIDCDGSYIKTKKDSIAQMKKNPCSQ
jgi:hypothetical protein